MARLLKIWRSWSVRRRVLVLGGGAVVLAGIVALAAYLAFKRPADVSNPHAAFKGHKQKPKKGSDWPLYGYDFERTRYLPAKHLDPPFRSSLWSFQAGKLLEFQPIVVHGTIYFMDKDGEFYALDARKGRVDWKRKIGALNASSPAFADARLYAVNLPPQQAVTLQAHNRGNQV